MVSPGSATEEAGTAVPPAESEAERFGPNSAEVAAFIAAVDRLTESQWRRIMAARKAASLIVRDTSAPPADAVRAMLEGRDEAHGYAAEVNRALAPALGGKGDDKVIAAWQAANAVSRRRQLAVLTFVAHYAPFAEVIPPAFEAQVAPDIQRFVKRLRALGPEGWQALARAWTLERDDSAALLQATARTSPRDAEETAALVAIASVPKHLPGDAGWAAVKTVAHGARVLTCRGGLPGEQVAVLWSPLEDTIALASLDEPGPPAPRAPREPKPKAEPRKRTAARRGPLYGANHAEVSAFIKTVLALTPIQWLRVLDRRQLVASITRERSAEPAPVVRASLAAIACTKDADIDARCRVYSAVERAGYALESKQHLAAGHALEHYGALSEVVPFGEVDVAGFAARLRALNPEEWSRVAASAPEVQTSAVAPLVRAGDALVDALTDRSDDEVAVTWHAVTALVQRHLHSPIKFAASFAPFSSAVTIIKPRSLSPSVQRYLTAAGRLSAHQCSVLAEPWTLADDMSSVLARTGAGGVTRTAEEAAALVALVTVPMRLTGDAGWAAAKTLAYGARVAACRERLSAEELESLWKPLERAIPLSALGAPPKTK